MTSLRILNKTKKEEKQKTLKRFGKLKLLLVALLIIATIYYYFQPYLMIALGHIDFYFTAFLVTAIVSFQQNDIQIGAICLAVQIAAYIAFLFVMKVTVFDMYFPKMRVITPTKDFYTIARKITQTTGGDPRFLYFMVKFHLRPILSWHKLKIPKPEYINKGIPGINRKQVLLENGFKGVQYRRMPASIDVLTNTLHINFNEAEQVYELGLKAYNYRPDLLEPYAQSTFDGVQSVGTNIIESVKGDYGLIKGQFNMGIVIRERKLPGTEIPKKPEIKKED